MLFEPFCLPLGRECNACSRMLRKKFLTLVLNYIRWQIENGELEFRFIAGKSRVASLELQSAAIASRLGKSILEESRLEFERIIYFTDSQVILA